MNCTPQALSLASSPLRALTDHQLSIARLRTLCAWANAVSAGLAPTAPTSPDITDTSAQNAVTVTWANSMPLGATNEIWKSTDGIAFVLFSTVAGNATQTTDSTGMIDGNIWYYKVRACDGTNCSAFTSVVSVSYNYTSPNVASVNFPTLVVAISFFKATGLALLTSVSLPKLRTVTVGAGGILDLSNNANLTSITLTALKTVAGALFFGSDKITGAFSLPALTSTGADLQIQGNTLMTSLSAPLLTSIAGIGSFSGCTALASVTMTSLQTVGSRLDFSSDAALTSLNLPALTSITDRLDIPSCTSLTSVSLPALTAINGSGGVFAIDGAGCTLLVTFSAPQVIIPNAGLIINLSLGALNAASVNQVLARCVASGLGGGTDIELAGGTNAAPSGQGIVDKATLIANGCTVNTN